jgi:hypothetical protein
MFEVGRSTLSVGRSFFLGRLDPAIPEGIDKPIGTQRSAEIGALF